MSVNIARCGAVAAVGSLLAFAGTAAGSFNGSGISISMWDVDSGSMYVTDLSVTGDFDGNDRFVARADLDSIVIGQDASGNDITMGSESGEASYVELEILGSNLRSSPTSFIANLNFNVQAGFGNTGFSIAATPVAAPLNLPVGTASAAISLTESSNPFAAAGVTMSPDNGRIYEANYNGGSTVFTDLFTSALTVAAGGGSDSFNDTFTGPIGGAITDIGASFEFTLSAFDLASGTSTFVVTPAPGAAALLGLGGLLAARRRR